MCVLLFQGGLVNAQDYVWNRQSSSLTTDLASKVSITESFSLLEMFIAGGELILDMYLSDVTSDYTAATLVSSIGSGLCFTYGEADATGTVALNPDGQTTINVSIGGTNGVILIAGDLDGNNPTMEDPVAACAVFSNYFSDVVFQLERLSEPTGSTTVAGTFDWAGFCSSTNTYSKIDVEVLCGNQIVFYAYTESLYIDQGELHVGSWEWGYDLYGPCLEFVENVYPLSYGASGGVNFSLPWTVEAGQEFTIREHIYLGLDVTVQDYGSTTESGVHSANLSLTTGS